MHDRGFAAAGGADDGEEAVLLQVMLQALHDVITTEEIILVLFAKDFQTTEGANRLIKPGGAFTGLLARDADRQSLQRFGVVEAVAEFHIGVTPQKSRQPAFFLSKLGVWQ